MFTALKIASPGRALARVSYAFTQQPALRLIISNSLRALRFCSPMPLIPTFCSSTSRYSAELRLQSFSSTPAARDVAKVTLVGRLGADPQLRETRAGKPYYQYIIATQGASRKQPDGKYTDGPTSWHTVYAYSEPQQAQLARLGKGTTVYVEADLEMLKSEPIEGKYVPSKALLRQLQLRVVGARVKPESEEGEGTEGEAE